MVWRAYIYLQKTLEYFRRSSPRGRHYRRLVTRLEVHGRAVDPEEDEAAPSDIGLALEDQVPNDRSAVADDRVEQCRLAVCTRTVDVDWRQRRGDVEDLNGVEQSTCLARLGELLVNHAHRMFTDRTTDHRRRVLYTHTHTHTHTHIYIYIYIYMSKSGNTYCCAQCASPIDQ